MPKKLRLTHMDIGLRCHEMAKRILNQVGRADIAIYGVPRGGIPVAYLLLNHLPGSYIVQEPHSANVIVDDVIDSGATSKKHSIYEIAFFALYNKLDDDKDIGWLVFPWEGTEEKSIEDAFTRILQFAGENPKREGLLETPARAAKAWKFWTSGYDIDPKSVFKSFKDGGEKYDTMVLVDNIPFFSHCEHHMAAIFGTAHIAYIPNGRIAGLSKFARLVDVFARRLQVQERLTTQIADVIHEVLEPLGVAVYIEARHFCMESRGVQKPGSITKTSAMRGIFTKDTGAKAEFFNLIKR